MAEKNTCEIMIRDFIYIFRVGQARGKRGTNLGQLRGKGQVRGLFGQVRGNPADKSARHFLLGNVFQDFPFSFHSYTHGQPFKAFLICLASKPRSRALELVFPRARATPGSRRSPSI